MNPRLLATSLALGLAALFAPAAVAQTVITSVPYIINAPGKYVLGGNLDSASRSQSPIIIRAPNVILDLNGFYVSGPVAMPAGGVAVIFVQNVSNVTIRNGTVANCGAGIAFEAGANASNHLVENVNATRCYNLGIAFYGDAPGSLVRRCRISQIAGDTVPNRDASGISALGGVRIEKCSVNGVATTNGGTAYGIRAQSGSFAIGNTISDSTFGVFGGKYQNTLTFGCATPFSGGTNAGGNN